MTVYNCQKPQKRKRLISSDTETIIEDNCCCNSVCKDGYLILSTENLQLKELLKTKEEEIVKITTKYTNLENRRTIEFQEYKGTLMELENTIEKYKQSRNNKQFNSIRILNSNNFPSPFTKTDFYPAPKIDFYTSKIEAVEQENSKLKEEMNSLVEELNITRKKRIDDLEYFEQGCMIMQKYLQNIESKRTAYVEPVKDKDDQNSNERVNARATEEMVKSTLEIYKSVDNKVIIYNANENKSEMNELEDEYHPLSDIDGHSDSDKELRGSPGRVFCHITYCSGTLCDRTSLEEEMKKYTRKLASGKMQCTACKAQIQYLNELKQHLVGCPAIRNNTELTLKDNKRICLRCNKECSSWNNLQRHLHMHIDESYKKLRLVADLKQNISEKYDIYFVYALIHPERFGLRSIMKVGISHWPPVRLRWLIPQYGKSIKMALLCRFNKDNVPVGRTPHLEALTYEFALCFHSPSLAGDGNFKAGDGTPADVDAEKRSKKHKEEALELLKRCLTAPQLVNTSDFPCAYCMDVLTSAELYTEHYLTQHNLERVPPNYYCTTAKLHSQITCLPCQNIGLDKFWNGPSATRGFMIHAFTKHNLGLTDTDILDLKKYTDIIANEEIHPQLENWFWRWVLKSDMEVRNTFLKAVTTTKQVPILGFASLKDSQDHITRLRIIFNKDTKKPKADNLNIILFLPVYISYERLDDELTTWAIELKNKNGKLI